MPALTYLTIPGYTGSGSRHWLTLWELNYKNFQRMEEEDWNRPDCARWTATLGDQIDEIDGTVVLVAHSLGCNTAVQWMNRQFDKKVRAAFLVAPADPDNPNFPPAATGYNALPLDRLPVPSSVVVSSNDPYLDLNRASFFAKSWNSELHNVIEGGHLDSDSKLGLWPEGKKLLDELCSKIRS